MREHEGALAFSPRSIEIGKTDERVSSARYNARANFACGFHVKSIRAGCDAQMCLVYTVYTLGASKVTWKTALKEDSSVFRVYTVYACTSAK